METKIDEAKSMQEDPNLPTMNREQGENGKPVFVVRDEKGTVAYRSEDEQSAMTAHREMLRTRITGSTTGIVESLQYLDRVNQALARGEDVQKLILDDAPRNLLDEYEANPTEQTLDNLFQTVRAFGMDINEPSELANFPVLASNQGALAEGIYRSVIRIQDGATGIEVMRDFSQDNLKRAMAEGRVSMDWVREQLNEVIPLIESERTERNLRTETDTDVIESFSDVAVAYMNGKIRDEQIPGGLRGFLRRIAVVVKDIFRRAYRLKRAIAEGKVSGDFEAFLAESVGINQQTMVDTTRERVGGELTQGLFSYSIGSMPEDQRAAEQSGQPSRGGLNAKTNLDAGNPASTFDQSNEYINSQGDRGAGNQADSSSPFFDASSEIDTGGSEAADRDASRIRQTQSLIGWAQSRSSLIDPEQIDSLPLVSNSTSEHEVHYRESDNRAVKRTWPGVYGQIPAPKNGKLDRANATPSEYLVRQGLQASVFGSDIRLEGVSFSDKPSMVLFEPPGQPSFVISQEWFEKSEAPTLDEIADRLSRDGFLPVPNSYFGWFRPSDRVVIVDAKTDNFVKTPAGVIPLDLQMAVFTPEQVAEAGLDSFETPAPSPGATISSIAQPVSTDTNYSIGSPAFSQWFGESKVVDSDGKPMVVYHGTTAEVSKFTKEGSGEFGRGHYFAPRADSAAYFGGRGGETGLNIMPVYLSMQRPLRVDVAKGGRDKVRAMGQTKIREQGYDGIIATGLTGEVQYVVFEPTQIKSATGNRGTFDPTSANINYSIGVDSNDSSGYMGTRGGNAITASQKIARDLGASSRAIQEAQPGTSARDAELQAIRDSESIPWYDIGAFGQPDTVASEHQIWFDEGQVYKATAYGRFGHSIEKGPGNASPLEYLRRIAALQFVEGCGFSVGKSGYGVSVGSTSCSTLILRVRPVALSSTVT
jgi:hypothetical protein